MAWLLERRKQKNKLRLVIRIINAPIMVMGFSKA